MKRAWPQFVYPIADAARRLRGRGYPLHRREQFDPLFIIGSGRCGMTLLRRILQAGGEVHLEFLTGHEVQSFEPTA